VFVSTFSTWLADCSSVAVGPSEPSFLVTPVAVVDVKKNTVVWTGVVSSTRSKLAIRGSSAFEKEAYDWLCDLLAALKRNVRDPGTRFEPRI
jgi:hypothetical protein